MEKLEEIKSNIDVNVPKLIFVGGSSFSGKTTMSMKISEYYSSKDIPVIFFSLELSKGAIRRNIICNSNLDVVDNVPVTIDMIEEICRTKKDKVNLVVIDYLQLISYDKSKMLSRNMEIEDIVKRLKVLVKELGITIIVTSQLIKNVEDKTQVLRYSNDIIDTVVFL